MSMGILPEGMIIFYYLNPGVVNLLDSRNFGPKHYNSIMKLKPELINANLNTFKNKIISII